jgi:hypothetical protein
MMATYSSKISVSNYKTAQYHKPEDYNLINSNFCAIPLCKTFSIYNSLQQMKQLTSEVYIFLTSEDLTNYLSNELQNWWSYAE